MNTRTNTNTIPPLRLVCARAKVLVYHPREKKRHANAQRPNIFGSILCFATSRTTHDRRDASCTWENAEKCVPKAPLDERFTTKAKQDVSRSCNLSAKLKATATLSRPSRSLLPLARHPAKRSCARHGPWPCLASRLHVRIDSNHNALVGKRSPASFLPSLGLPLS